MSKEERIEYLEEERKKIWKSITDLQDQLSKKTSDYENEAKLSAEQASAFTSKSEEATNTTIQNLEAANTKLAEIKVAFDAFEKLNKEIQEYAKNSKENNEAVKLIHETVQSKSEIILPQIADIEKIIEGKPALDEKLKKLGDVFTQGDDYDSKLATLHQQITERKKEIDKLYYGIIGYVDKNEKGEETKVKGLKEELEESYNAVKLKLTELEKELLAIKDNAITSYREFSEKKENEFSASLTNWKAEYSKVLSQIEILLPNALTAGLSAAYSEKKRAEETESTNLARTFRYGIGGLIAISLIPFTISIVSIFKEVDIETVILRIPRLVLAILPLYVPVLWVAYSANRKMNLAKRLIEEYSHKEVLSKTFEGLSGQINNISDKDISSDLRIKLLYNILEVNSENPGKLISDYNKSDHPLMDALDKSIKLSNAFTKLAKIPGFAKLASSYAKRAEDILKEENKKAEAGIESISTEKAK